MIDFRHIRGILRQELYLTLHSLEIVVDVFVFPLIFITMFGLISLYLAGNEAGLEAKYVFLGMLLWQVVAVTAYSVAVGAMWNIWSRNLSNMFISPLRVKEYVLALFTSGCLKAFSLLTVGMLLSITLFRFNILDVGLVNLALSFVVFAFFGFAMAVATLGLIFRFGTRLAALSWSIPWLFQPLSAAFFPIADLPVPLQYIAHLMPPSYAFEASRHALSAPEIEWGLYMRGFGLDMLYCAIAIVIFSFLFAKSKEVGQFARNES